MLLLANLKLEGKEALGSLSINSGILGVEQELSHREGIQVQFGGFPLSLPSTSAQHLLRKREGGRKGSR